MNGKLVFNSEEFQQYLTIKMAEYEQKLDAAKVNMEAGGLLVPDHIVQDLCQALKINRETTPMTEVKDEE